MNKDEILLERLFLVLFKWFHLNWWFNTDRRLKKKGRWESVKGVQDCSVGVNITVIKGKKFGAVDNQQLNTGWLLNIVLHNTGLTVHN